MSIARILLFPFSILYDAITRTRNHLFNIGQKKSFRFDIMVISVGNLSVGGSGKSPMVEYLIGLLRDKFRIATLSRGYGRTTKGFRIATPSDSAATLGDEPYQFFRKFGQEIQVAVGEDRAFAIPNILQAEPPPDVVLMDDAFQHRTVDPQLSILLTDYRHPFYTDHVLPAGNLREARLGARRSDLVIVTKCPPELSPPEFSAIEKMVWHYAPDKPVFFTTVKYGSVTPFSAANSPSTDIVLVSGIANSADLEKYVDSRFTLLRHFRYRDHHRYTNEDLSAIHDFCRQVQKPVTIVTTEKDMVKLIDPVFKEMIATMTWAYIPVEVSFLKNGSDFDSLVLRSVDSHEKQKDT